MNDCLLAKVEVFPTISPPGSKLSAATGWYETYYDIYYEGKFVFKIE